MKGFVEFIKEQGVVGLAVGFILGGAISKLVAAIVTDLIDPLLSLIPGAGKGINAAYFRIGSAKFMYGNLLSVFVDFVVVALVVYFGVKLLRLGKLDEQKK